MAAGPWEQLATRQDDFPPDFMRPEPYELITAQSAPVQLPKCTGKACGPSCQGACTLCTRTAAAADLSAMLGSSALATLAQATLQPRLSEQLSTGGVMTREALAQMQRALAVRNACSPDPHHHTRPSDAGRAVKQQLSFRPRLSLPLLKHPTRISPRPSYQDSYHDSELCVGGREGTVVVKDLSFNLSNTRSSLPTTPSASSPARCSEQHTQLVYEPGASDGGTPGSPSHHPRPRATRGAPSPVLHTCRGKGCGPDCQGACLVCSRTGAENDLAPMLSIPITSTEGLLSLSPRPSARDYPYPSVTRADNDASSPASAHMVSTVTSTPKAQLTTRRSAPLFRRVRSAQPRDLAAAMCTTGGLHSGRLSGSPVMARSLAGLPMGNEVHAHRPARLSLQLIPMVAPLPGQEEQASDAIIAQADLHAWDTNIDFVPHRPSTDPVVVSQRCRPSGTACVSVSEYSTLSQGLPQPFLASASTPPHLTRAGTAATTTEPCTARAKRVSKVQSDVQPRHRWLRALLSCNCLQAPERVVFDTLPFHGPAQDVPHASHSTKVVPFLSLGMPPVDENGSWWLHATGDSFAVGQDSLKHSAGHVFDLNDEEERMTWDGRKSGERRSRLEEPKPSPLPRGHIKEVYDAQMLSRAAKHSAHTSLGLPHHDSQELPAAAHSTTPVDDGCPVARVYGKRAAGSEADVALSTCKSASSVGSIESVESPRCRTGVSRLYPKAPSLDASGRRSSLLDASLAVLDPAQFLPNR